MPQAVYYAIRIVHLLSMAVWFAGALTLTGDIRRTLARGKPHTDLLAGRVSRSLFISTLAGVVTILSGLGMIFSLGGFGAVSPRIHIGFTLALVLLGVEFLVLRERVLKLGSILESPEPKDFGGLVSGIAAVAGVTHLIKLVILCLMVIKG